jgi:hypothetical protein
MCIKSLKTHLENSASSIVYKFPSFSDVAFFEFQCFRVATNSAVEPTLNVLIYSSQ